MNFSKPQQLLVLTSPIKFGRASALGVTVGFGFRLSDPRILAHETEIWSAVESAPMAYKVLDEVGPKLFAEWLLAGHAQTLIDPAQSYCRWNVDIRVGDCQKQIQCCLPATPPQDPDNPLLRLLPIDHTLAYGGEGWKANPVGSGHQAGSAAPLLTLPGQTPGADERLAATAPLDPRWQQRADFMFHKKRDFALDSDHRAHPGWPENMDRRYFQIASRDQWSADKFWPDICHYRLSGIGPAGRGFVGQMPPLEAQAIVRRKGEQAYESVPLQRQTLWFFPDRDLAAVLFHGQVEIEDIFSETLDHMLLALGECGAVHALPELARIAALREDRTRNTLESMRDEALMPPSARGWAWEYLLDPDENPRQAFRVRPYAEVQARMQQYQSVLMAASGAMQTAKEQRLDDVRQQTRALMNGQGVPESEMDKQDWRAELASWPRDRRRDDLIIRNCDLSRMDFSGQAWQGVQLINVDLGACLFRDADLRNTLFIGCRLEAAKFENCLLDSCHFSHCVLDKSHWLNNQLSTVQFIEGKWNAVLVQGGEWKTNFIHEGQGHGMVWRTLHGDSLQLQACVFPELSLIETRLEGHAFLDCQLPGLQIRRSQIEKSSWVACRMPDSRFEDNQFAVVVFADACQLDGARWTRCELSKAFFGETAFSGSLSQHCSWLETSSNAFKASHSQWVACDLSRAQLMHADFSKAIFVGSALKEANLYGADLSETQITESNLIGANLGSVKRQLDWQRHWRHNLMAGVLDYPRRKAE